MNIEKLVNIFNTLGNITINGYQNVTMMNYCMQTLKQVIEEEQKNKSQPAPDTAQN